MNYESERDMMPLRDAYPDGRRQRSRSVAVTIFLAVLIVLFSFTVSVNIHALTNPDSHRELRGQLPNAPGWFVPAITICAALNIVWAIVLLRWKKWAFYALALTSGVASGLHILSIQVLPLDRSLEPGEARDMIIGGASFAGALVILFVLLIIGGPRSTWRQLD